jgi:hypothetical protein
VKKDANKMCNSIPPVAPFYISKAYIDWEKSNTMNEWEQEREVNKGSF